MKLLIISTAVLANCLTIFSVVTADANIKDKDMQQLNLQTKIGDGSDKEITPLFEGERRNIVQITLRNRAVLESHKAAEPINILEAGLNNERKQDANNR